MSHSHGLSAINQFFKQFQIIAGFKNGINVGRKVGDSDGEEEGNIAESAIGGASKSVPAGGTDGINDGLKSGSGDGLLSEIISAAVAAAVGVPSAAVKAGSIAGAKDSNLDNEFPIFEQSIPTIAGASDGTQNILAELTKVLQTIENETDDVTGNVDV